MFGSSKCHLGVAGIWLDLVILLGLYVLINNMQKYWEIAQRGFFCEDSSLKYPYRQDTINRPMLFTIAVNIPLVLIIAVELCKSSVQLTQTQHQLRLRSLLVRLYESVTKFLFGLCAERLIKNVGKYTVGRLRPYFLTLCQPEFPDGSTCGDVANHGVYLESYKCRVDDGTPAAADLLHNSHVSFPSGHASISFYGMVFMVVYLERQFRHASRLSLLRRLSQLVCVLAAWYVALSRVVDYKHHVWDVVVGSLLGTVIGVLAAQTVDICLRERTHAHDAAARDATAMREFPVITPSISQKDTLGISLRNSGSPPLIVEHAPCGGRVLADVVVVHEISN